ncbi:MAG: GIY-YIG nuclease family protein [Bacteroidota bacterium]
MNVYVIYSKKLDRYYIGQTDRSTEVRLKDHNENTRIIGSSMRVMDFLPIKM